MLYFIVNETSRTGKGAGIWQEVQMILQREKIPYKAYVTEYEGHTFSLARNICKMPDDDICLVVLGGDGTVNEAINGMVHFEKVRFGVIPNGSGNDFARGLGLPKSTEENLNQILACMKKGKDAYSAIDLGQVEYSNGRKPRLFAISAGVGLDAIVCKKALHSRLKKVLNKLHLGKLTYLLLTVGTLFSMETADVSAHFDQKGAKNQKKMIFSAAMNLRAEGGGVPMAPKASPQDGKLSVCTACGIPKWLTFFYLPFLVAAKHETIHGFEVVDCQTYKMHIKTPMVLHADGEDCGDVTDVIFTCLPGKLHVMKG